jgi:hypothetical protein
MITQVDQKRGKWKVVISIERYAVFRTSRAWDLIPNHPVKQPLNPDKTETVSAVLISVPPGNKQPAAKIFYSDSKRLIPGMTLDEPLIS